jgi:hypothetical protein
MHDWPLGLDGELPESDVRGELINAGSEITTLDASDVSPHLSALEYHPSEATMLVAASAIGVTGLAEIRDKGALVPVNRTSADAYIAPCDAILGLNAVAQALVGTRHFGDAEALTRGICGRTELDHECRKATAHAHNRSSELNVQQLRLRFRGYCESAAQRGVDLVSFRRLTEVIGKHRYDPPAMRALLGDLAFSNPADVPDRARIRERRGVALPN